MDTLIPGCLPKGGRPSARARKKGTKRPAFLVYIYFLIRVLIFFKQFLESNYLLKGVNLLFLISFTTFAPVLVIADGTPDLRCFIHHYRTMTDKNVVVSMCV